MYNFFIFRSMKKVFPLLIVIGSLGIFVAILQLARGKELQEVYYPLFIGVVLIGSALIERKRHVKK